LIFAKRYHAASSPINTDLYTRRAAPGGIKLVAAPGRFYGGLRVMIFNNSKAAHGIAVAISATLAGGFIAGTANADAKASVVSTWNVGGAGGWDYLTLDPKTSRLFISRATRVDVLDVGSGKVIGSIANTNGVHGIALAPEFNRGYTSNGRADSVTSFDMKSLSVIKEAPVGGHNPDAILYEPVGKHVFTFNGRSKDVSVLDADSLALVSTLPVPDKPEFAVTDGAGKIYVNIESDVGQIVVINARKLAVEATWSLPGCASPSGLALDNKHHRLFSVCDGKVMAVTDAISGKQIAKVAIGEGPDAAAFDSTHGLAFSSNGEGSLTIVRQEAPDRYSVQQTLATKRGARTMALDEAGRKVYLVTSDFDPPPAPTTEQPHPRATPKADTFTVMVVAY
jgi:DNA-binding beta-propeller fold protein YncE